MEEKQKIQRQLHQLRQECIKEYLEPKLSAIASKEVIYDILTGFLEAHNNEFLQNIAESIFQVKQNNRGLKEAMENLKASHQQQLIELRRNILGQEQSHQKSELQKITKQFQVKISEMETQSKTNIGRIQEIEQQKSITDEKIRKLESQYLKYQQQLSASKAKCELLTNQLEQLKIELVKNHQYFAQLKQSSQKNMNDINGERQIQRQKFIEQIQKQKSQFAIREGKLKSTVDENYNHQKDLFLNEIGRKQKQIANYTDCLNKIKQRNLMLESKDKDERSQLQKQQLLHKQVSENAKMLTKQLQSCRKQLQSNDIAIKYLQGENNYLREEILSFRTRFDTLEQEKIKITQQFNQFAIRSQEDQQDMQKGYREEVQIIRNTMKMLKDEEQSKIYEMNTELQQLRSELQTYHRQIEQNTETIQTLSSANYTLQQQKTTLSDDIERYISGNQVHEQQIYYYEKQLTKARHQYNQEIERQKITFELNWNKANQELLQEKFKATQLTEENSKLKEQLAIEKQKQKYYTLYASEIQQLKKQLKLYNPNSLNQKHIPSNKRQKIYYFISKINEELKLLKTESKQFEELIFKSIAEYNSFYQQTLQYLLLKSRQEYSQCSYCQKQDQFKHSLNMNIAGPKLQKTMQKGYHQSRSFGTIKKVLKNIQLKYEVVNQSNTFYSHHIDSLIRQQ